MLEQGSLEFRISDGETEARNGEWTCPEVPRVGGAETRAPVPSPRYPPLPQGHECPSGLPCAAPPSFAWEVEFRPT